MAHKGGWINVNNYGRHWLSAFPKVVSPVLPGGHGSDRQGCAAANNAFPQGLAPKRGGVGVALPQPPRRVGSSDFTLSLPLQLRDSTLMPGGSKGRHPTCTGIPGRQRLFPFKRLTDGFLEVAKFRRDGPGVWGRAPPGSSLYSRPLWLSQRWGPAESRGPGVSMPCAEGFVDCPQSVGGR